MTPNWAPLLRFFLFTNIATSKAVLCLVFTSAWEPRAGGRECRCLGPSVAALRLLQARTITGGRPRENWSNFHGSQNPAAPGLGLLVHCLRCAMLHVSVCRYCTFRAHGFFWQCSFYKSVVTSFMQCNVTCLYWIGSIHDCPAELQDQCQGWREFLFQCLLYLGCVV